MKTEGHLGDSALAVRLCIEHAHVVLHSELVDMPLIKWPFAQFKDADMYQRILVPLDGRETSKSGLLEAIKLAKSQAARLKLFHVVDEHIFDAGYRSGTYGSLMNESFLEEGKKVLADASALVRQFGVEPEAVAVESLRGTVAEVIVAQAKEWKADLIVMGTHGRRGLKRLAMGSQAEDVVRRTRIPVLLVHDESTDTPEMQMNERDSIASIHAGHA